LFEFFSNSNHDLAREFFKQRICDSKLNIYFGGMLCQAQTGWSHNHKFLFFAVYFFEIQQSYASLKLQ